MRAPTLLGGLTPDRFLRRHWQKKPLLIRGALPGFRDPITPARLLALAARAGVESRLVRERGGARKWEVTDGPLPRTLTSALGTSHWTVLVQNVDAHVPAVADLVERFDFLPRWRVDDVMISLAAPRGSVGPH
ncbi:MAG TPA: cupin domain-containing protein, partial [Vicinamibacteria bacterium]|nr:cupin domain-containing protein [Vicinamibacteria bacterium]